MHKPAGHPGIPAQSDADQMSEGPLIIRTILVALAHGASTEKPPYRTGTGAILAWCGDSDCVNLISLRTLRTLGGLELHPLALVEGTEAGRLDRAVVHEYVGAAA